MCFHIDDSDKAFEEESRRHNQDALSTSNGLALDLRAGTQSSIANGWGCARQEREKAVHRRWRRGGNGKKTYAHMHPLLISKREKLFEVWMFGRSLAVEALLSLELQE